MSCGSLQENTTGMKRRTIAGENEEEEDNGRRRGTNERREGKEVTDYSPVCRREKKTLTHLHRLHPSLLPEKHCFNKN